MAIVAQVVDASPASEYEIERGSALQTRHAAPRSAQKLAHGVD